ncbi:MAG: FAD-dependent oxidoreductase, partial [Trueperaceae bacterium]|nr:FAD-dependent oxidoreductase [Trueperaceae bacterium]
VLDGAGGAWINALALAPGVLEGRPGDVGRVATAPASVRRAAEADLRVRLEAALADLPAHLAPRVPGFVAGAPVRLAPSPYRRETVHLRAACTLRGADVLAHRSGPLDVAVGGYPLDVQATRHAPGGVVIADPLRYGVPLCTTVPADGPDGLWAVGRGVGYDPVAYASARVAPLGVAVGEAVGVAAVEAVRAGRSARDAALDATFVAGVRAALSARGAVLPAPPDPPPVAAAAPYGSAFRTLAAYGLAAAGYANAPAGEVPVTCATLRRQVAGVLRRAGDAPAAARDLERARVCRPGPATSADAARVQRHAACLARGACAGAATPAALRAEGFWPAGVPEGGPLLRGQAWALAASWAGPPDAAP